MRQYDICSQLVTRHDKGEVEAVKFGRKWFR